MTISNKKSKYSKSFFLRLILFFEAGGFLLIIILLWLNELLDLPHTIFGAMATPVNFNESLIETVFILIFAVPVLTGTRIILKNMQYLEGILTVCSYCKKIKTENGWVAIESYIGTNTAADFSHGFCPDCFKEHFKYHSE